MSATYRAFFSILHLICQVSSGWFLFIYLFIYLLLEVRKMPKINTQHRLLHRDLWRYRTWAD